MLAALRSRDFRLFWCSALVANLGLWIQTVALGWLVYSLTGKASWLGTVSFVGNAPTLVLGLLGGAIADRTSRRAIMLASLLVLAASAGTLAVLAAAGRVAVWHVLGLAVVSGTATALYTPAMHSSLPSLVEPAQLLNAISLNSVQFNLARAVGPALAGGLYATIGPAGCFAVNAAGFVVQALVLTRVRLPRRAALSPPPVAHALREGIRYARRHATIGRAILLAAALSLLGFPYIILLPAVARDVLHLDAGGLGILMSGVGAGAVVGGLGLAGAGEVGRAAALPWRTAFLHGTALVGFAFVRSPAATWALLFALGGLQTVTIAALTTAIQLHVDDGMRGRVLGMLTVVFFGFSTLGGLLGGVAGDRVGVARALAAGGALVAAAAALLPRAPAA